MYKNVSTLHAARYILQHDNLGYDSPETTPEATIMGYDQLTTNANLDQSRNMIIFWFYRHMQPNIHITAVAACMRCLLRCCTGFCLTAACCLLDSFWLSEDLPTCPPEDLPT